jgi:hypothetical protein
MSPASHRSMMPAGTPVIADTILSGVIAYLRDVKVV